MKTYFQVVHKLGDDMYSLYKCGEIEYHLRKEIETAAYIFDVRRPVLRADIESYIKKTYKLEL